MFELRLPGHKRKLPVSLHDGEAPGLARELAFEVTLKLLSRLRGPIGHALLCRDARAFGVHNFPIELREQLRVRKLARLDEPAPDKVGVAVAGG